MKKIFSFCAAVLVALAANAQGIPSTDFSGGYFFDGANAVLEGEVKYDPSYLRYYDQKSPGTASWQITAKSACYVKVTLNLADNSAISTSQKHIFQVLLLDAEGNKLDSVAEGKAYATDFTEYGVDKVLDGSIRVPAAGVYTVKLLNNREHSKCGIYGITFTREILPESDFAAPGYYFEGSKAALEGNIWFSEEDSLYYNDKQEPGVASWKITATRACYVSATLNFKTGSASGAKMTVEVLNDEAKSVGSVSHGYYSADGDVAMSGTILIPTAGDYTVKLINTQGWSSAKLRGITLTYASDAPTVAIHAAWDWDNDIIFALSKDGKSASATKHLAKGDYEFKMLINGDWRANSYWYKVEGPCGKGGINADGSNMKLIAYMAGDYTFEWFFENDSINITFPTPKLAAGYYLVGIFGGTEEWGVETLTAAKKFATTEEPGELLLNYTLAADDQIKVVEVNEIDEIIKWFPEGSAPNYTVDAAHAGTRDIYFRPAGNSDAQWQEFGGFIWMGKNDETGINNVEAGEKAVKMIENGQLVIIKNGVKYNVVGSQIK